MILNSTNDIIRLRLDGTVATNQLPWVTGFNDHTTTTFVAGDEDGASNNTTNVTIVSAPGASTQRQVTTINVYNADTVARGVIIEKFDGTNGRILCNCLLAVGDTLYWSREGGWTVMKTGTGENSIILQEYIASGTWNKPAGIKAALLVAVGGGGGAGSGRRGPIGTDRFGGSGGGGGAMVWYFVQGASLSSSMAITIGAGGTGGAAQTVDTTNGNAGTNGGSTDIGSVIVARSGSAGQGGSTTAQPAGAGGISSSSSPSRLPYAIAGTNGTAGLTTGTATKVAAMDTTSADGGNGARGINSVNTNGTGTLTMQGIYVNGSIQGGTTTPGANGQNDLALSLVFNNSINGSYGLGTGGNGGDVAAAGGNGGRCAGGGGGGGSLNGTNSGKGGNGGGGLAKILEIY